MAAIQNHKNLLSLWAKEPKDLAKIQEAVNNLNDVLGDSADLTEDQYFLISKDLYEITALLSIAKNDLEEFDSTISQVLTFYDMAPNHSEHKYLMIGLNLMFLLAKNRLSEFHMLLERAPQSERISNPYINVPLRLEQSLMEGAYNKVVLTEKNIPSPFYSGFIRIMVDAVRREIAVSIEKSFKVLSVKDATAMLLFDSTAQLAEFAKLRNWKQQGDLFFFEAVEVSQDKPLTLDTKRIATQNIFYAKQLEQIV